MDMDGYSVKLFCQLLCISVIDVLQLTLVQYQHWVWFGT